MCANKLIFDFLITDDVTSHLNDSNFILRGKDKLVPRLVNDISTFKIMYKTSKKLKSKDVRKFPQLKEQSECDEFLANFTEYIKKIIVIQEAFESRISDFAEEEDCILAFINPFTRTEQNILTMPSEYRWNLMI